MPPPKTYVSTVMQTMAEPSQGGMPPLVAGISVGKILGKAPAVTV